MSAGVDFVQYFKDIPNSFDDVSCPLNQFETFSDRPELHQTLAHAELIVCRIRAYYNLIQEICSQSVNTGEAFSSSLFKLAKCIGLGFDQKQLWTSNTNLTSEWDQSNAEKILNHAANLMNLFAKKTRKLATKISDIENILTKSNDNLNKLHDLRSNFQSAHENLESAINRAASANPVRSVDLHTFDNQVKKAQEVYQTSATLYLSHIRQIIGPNYIVSYLRLIILALSVQQSYSEQVNSIFNISNKTNTLTSSMLVSELKNLVANIEKKSAVDVSSDTKAAKTSFGTKKDTADLNNSLNTRLEGYLFKRSGKKGWRTWVRRWFRVNDNQLMYCKRFPGLTSTDLQSASDAVLTELNQKVNMSTSSANRLTNGPSVNTQPENNFLTQLTSQAAPQWIILENNLRFCTARVVQPNKRLTTGDKQMNLLHHITDRRFVFELVSSGHKTYYLQAGSADELNLWVNTLRSGFHDLCQTDLQRITNDSLNLSRSRSPTQISLDFSNSPSVSSASGFLTSRTNDPCAQASQSSLPDYDALKNKSGVLLWREPDLAGNRFCADCGDGDAKWASINLGVTLCTLCAAVHRSLGVHISKVRSLTLDNWQPELLHVMLNLGNKFVNEIFEANRNIYTASEFPRISTTTPFEQRKAFIEAKWVRLKFARLPIPSRGASDSTEATRWIKQLYDNWIQARAETRYNFPELICHPVSSSSLASIPESNSLDKKLNRHNAYRYAILDQLINVIKTLYEKHKLNTKSRSKTLFHSAEQKKAAENLVCFGARLGCPLLILSGLAGGATPEVKMKLGESSVSYPALILASRIGSIAASEFLLLNGADIDVKDDHGRTALHHACRFGRVHLVCLLLRRRANQMISDDDGKLPLDFALELANADIVTLLRLQRLNDTAKNSDMALNDETVSDVFHDFTSRTYYLNCDDYNDDGANDDDDTVRLSRELYDPSFSKYTTDRVVKIRPNYQVDSSTLPNTDNNNGKSSNDGVLIISPTVTIKAKISPVSTAVDVRRRRDRK
uniref:ANK_REP_REGION domain-containing protein n=1 Tax=Trichobilharzia regenti TaxID=157069 RepID=A0AA85KAI1_TRIRE|nr:unnamed protein product [Trichobilharzia regenti]